MRHFLNKHKTAQAFIICLALAGCSSDSSDSSSSPNTGDGTRTITPNPNPPIATRPPFAPVSEDFTIDAEYQGANSLGTLPLVNADKAYARGATGRGVRIVAIDTAVVRTREFDQPGKLTFICQIDTRINCPTRSTSDTHSHGSRVLSIIGAERDGSGLQGVAYEATINMIDVGLGRGGAVYNPTVVASLRNADGRWANRFNVVPDYGDVSNNSWGVQGIITHPRYMEANLRSALSRTIASMRRAQQRGTIIVFAAGNAHGDCRVSVASGSTCPNSQIVNATDPEVLAGLPYYVTELQGLWLAAVAVGVGGGLHPDPRDVRGVIAYYSNRCGVAQAFCIAAPGTARGIRNNGTYTVGRGTSFAAPHVAGALALLIQHFRDPQGVEQMSRAEIVERLLTTANKTGRYSREATIDAQYTEITTDTGTVSNPNAGGIIYGQGLLDLDAATAPAGGTNIISGTHLGARAFSYGGSRMLPAAAFGDALAQFASGRTLAIFDTLDAPFFVPLGSVVSAPVADGLARRFAKIRHGNEVKTQGASFAWGGKNVFASVHTRLAEGGISAALEGDVWRAGLFADADDDSDDDAGRIYGGVIGFAPLRGVSLELGALVETQTFLNAEGAGAFAHEDSRTIFASLAGDMALGMGWALNARFHAGLSDTHAVHNALFAPDGRVLTSAFDVSVERRGVIATEDTFGFHISQPLRVEDGLARFTYPTGRTPAGAVLQARERVSLEPSGRRIDMDVVYTYGAWQGRLGISRHPGHIRGEEAVSASVVFSHKY